MSKINELKKQDDEQSYASVGNSTPTQNKKFKITTTEILIAVAFVIGLIFGLLI